MKKRHYLLIFGLVPMLVSCLSTLELKLYTPPEITLPSHIKSLGLLDHSQEYDSSLPEGPQFVSISIPQTGPIDPKILSFASIIGAHEMAQSSADSLSTVKIDLQLRRPLPDSFPPPLPDTMIADLCKTYGVDGLLVQEYFAPAFTNMPREPGLAERFKKGSLSVGWRVYDAQDIRILFEDVFLQEQPYITYFNENNPGKSGDLIKQLATIEMANQAGATIIKIITPTYIEEARRLFTGKFGPTEAIATNMKKAGELAKQDQWQAAMDLWNPVANHQGYGKSCGKAAYNMAVGCEHFGSLELAVYWAKTAVRQGVSEALPYLEILQYRAGY